MDGRRVEIPADVLDAAEREYLAGATLKGTARKFEINHCTLRRRLIDRGTLQRNRPYRGEQHHNWKGGKVAGKYLLTYLSDDHPFAEMRYANGYVPVHRLVMAGLLGRPLTSNETVHHIDGNPMNNDPTNLQVRIGPHGRGASFVCGDCGSSNVLAQEIR